MKDFAVDFLQGVSSEIVVTVTGRTLKAGLAYPALLHGADDFQLIVFCDFIYFPKAVLKCSAYFFSKLINIPVNAERGIHSIHLIVPALLSYFLRSFTRKSTILKVSLLKSSRLIHTASFSRLNHVIWRLA